MNAFFRKALARAEVFFFKPASPAPLGALRIALALVLLAQVFLLRNSALDFLANNGMIQGDFAVKLSDASLPRLVWLVRHVASFSISESTCVYLVCWAYIGALVVLGLGVFTRTAAIASWFLHWVLMNSAESTSYGVDLYAHVFLFYLMFVPAGAAFSIMPGRRGTGVASTPACLGLRIMQLHLALTYFGSAIEKSMGPQWWNGELMWRALTLPEYAQFNMTWLAWWPKLSLLAGVGSLVLEGFYIVFIWPRRTRRFWALSIISMHLGIAVFLGLGCFGVLMACLNLALFLVSAEPRPNPIQVSETGVDEPSSLIVS